MKPVKVTKNQHGNYRGFVGGSMEKLFGDNEWLAREWLKEMVAKGHEVSDKSYLNVTD